MVKVGKTVQYRVLDGTGGLRSRAALVLRVHTHNAVLVDLYVLPEAPGQLPLYVCGVPEGLGANGDGLDAPGTWRFCQQD